MNKTFNNNNNNNNNTSNDFIENYQKAINNYSNIIKYYFNNYQIMECIFKIINSYKESILDFKKKLIQIKLNLLTPFYDDEEQEGFKFKGKIYSFNNQFLININKILLVQINSISDIIKDLDKNIFDNIKEKFNTNFLEIILQNRNNIMNQQKAIEKIFIDYNKEHKKFINEFLCIEEDVQKYYAYKKQEKKVQKLKDINKLFNEANYFHSIFLKIHYKFTENNKSNFDFYKEKLNEIKEEIIKNGNYTKNNINLFLLKLKDNSISFLDVLNNIIEKKKKNEIKENNSIKKEEEITIQNNINLFYKQYISKIESKYEGEKYKIKSIHSRILTDYLTQESRQMIKVLQEEFDIDEIAEPSIIALKEDDVFNIVKFFYSFDFVDKTEYDLILEEKNLEVINLTNKLLQPGLIKTKLKEYKGLLPINDEEIKLLKDYIGKNRKYKDTFIQVINNYRVYGKFDLYEREYELIGNYFLQIIDYIFEKKSEEDFELLNSTIILTQTFYVNKNGEKIYLFEKIKGHKIFFEVDYFIKYLKFDIKEKSNTNQKNALSTKNLEQVIYSHILTFHSCMEPLGMPKEKILQIIKEIYKEYNVREEVQNDINNIIESS